MNVDGVDGRLRRHHHPNESSDIRLDRMNWRRDTKCPESCSRWEGGGNALKVNCLRAMKMTVAMVVKWMT